MAWIVVLGASGWANAVQAQQQGAIATPAVDTMPSAPPAQKHAAATSNHAQATRPAKATVAMTQNASLRSVTAEARSTQGRYQPVTRNLMDSYRNALSPTLEPAADGR